MTLTSSKQHDDTVYIFPEWQFLCAFSHSIHAAMARLLNTQLRSNTGRSETWQAVCMQGHAVCLFHHQRVSTFTTSTLSWTDSLDGSHLSPHLIAVNRLPLPTNGASFEKRAKYHKLIMNCNVNSFSSKSRSKFVRGKSWWQGAINYSADCRLLATCMTDDGTA